MSRPIFIIGSPRSGTSILTWSLGQHPNLYPLEETVWFGRFGRAAGSSFDLGSSRGERSQLSAMGITRQTFFATLGLAIDQMILAHRQIPDTPVRPDAAFARARRPDDPKERWVDGTPENSFCVPELALLFPDACFIHLLRDADLVVRSLENFGAIGGRQHTTEEGYRNWMRHVRACLDAERSLGPDRIMRLEHTELAHSPVAAVRKCLEFAGESFSEDCLKPLGHRINSSGTGRPAREVPADVDPAVLAGVAALRADLADSAGARAVA